MNQRLKFLLLNLFALILCTVPVIIATLSYFPLWKERGSGAVLSGFTVFVLLLCIYPLFKLLKMLFRSPSVWMGWLLIFALFALVRSIADEMTVISFVGFISNSFGAVLFKLAGGIRKK